MVCASMWVEIFDGLFLCQTPWYMRGKRDNKEGDLNYAHLFPTVWGCKRDSGITEGGITENTELNFRASILQFSAATGGNASIRVYKVCY